MAYLRCSVSNGLRSSEVTVEVRDVDEQTEFLCVHREFVKQFDHQQYLPVGVVGQDRNKNLMLIELPHEGDSGTIRMWVASSALCEFHKQGSLATA